jgi:hypothetical protein
MDFPEVMDFPEIMAVPEIDEPALAERKQLAQ